ncbi:hypothetical protein BDN70DRAFT_998716 [Pholiota conissans]|uniref:Septin-type G domain-containing protein n=1 Tax=Pholiota conissans TaxID=109636 RepID=A0A9P6CLH8_9AGAR|nr:hypothetical protein BDN70DRAFT_998716 [Pholiota conissans]
MTAIKVQAAVTTDRPRPSWLPSTMEGTISTSADSVRTLYQPQPSETGHDQRESLQQQMAGTTIGDTECPQYAASSSGYSGVLVSGSSSPLRMHALVLPSPPDSPGGSPSPSVDSASESSLPSVSSSFFFSSSAPGSPGHSHPGSYPSSHPHSDHERDEQGHDSEHEDAVDHPHQGLIIPSLALPEPLRRPTPFGQTLGELRVLVLGAQGAGKSFLTGLLLEDNEHVIDVGTWEDWNAGDADASYAHGKVLRASTDWVEQKGMYGLERFEPTKNVEIVELPGYAYDADGTELIARLKSIIEGPFRSLHDVLHPDSDPSGVVASLLASPTSPLYTALIFLLPSPSTPLDKEIIQSLSAFIPVIALPRTHDTAHAHRRSFSNTFSTSSSKLSSFRPTTAVALRTGLFHSPETVALLRSEAADRFLRWREVERAVEGIWEGSTAVGDGRGTVRAKGKKSAAGKARRGGPRESSKAEGWSKAKWEAEWMEEYAQDVARRMRDADRHVPQRSRTGTMLPPLRVARSSSSGAQHPPEPTVTASTIYPTESSQASMTKDAKHRTAPCIHAPINGTPYDPLHLPSLLILSFSLLRECVGGAMRRTVGTLKETRVQVALVGGFCVGVGVGVWVRVGW